MELALAALIGAVPAALTAAAAWRSANLGLRQSTRTNVHLENGYKSALDRIDARTERFDAWIERHEAQHLNSN